MNEINEKAEKDVFIAKNEEAIKTNSRIIESSIERLLDLRWCYNVWTNNWNTECITETYIKVFSFRTSWHFKNEMHEIHFKY